MRGQLDISGNNIINIGSLGIGTATPAFALDISGASKFRDTLDLSTNNITNANQISATTNLVLQPTTGNVGIGTSVPASLLDVNGATKIRGTLDLSTNNITNANQISATTNLVLQPTTGNVGIGTSVPASLLDVNGATKIRGALDLSTNNITNANQISATTNLVLQPTTGNVGIGTSVPASLLDVNGATKIRGALDMTNQNIINANQISATTNLVLQPTTGNVGIGTSAPASLLDVNGATTITTSTASPLTINAGNQNSYPGLVIKGGGPGSNIASGFYLQNTGTNGITYRFYSDENGQLQINKSTSNNGITFTSNGRVGIGTSNPRFPLDVTFTVNGEYNSNTPTAMYLNYTYNYFPSGLKNISICGSDWIVGGNFAGYSDKRIKKNIQSLQTDKCIKMIRELNPVSYNYIDYVSKSTSEMYGFIAQEVINHVSPAISYKSDYIPNLYSHVKLSKYDDNTNKSLWKVTLNKSYTETGVFTFYANKDNSGNEYIGSDRYPLSDKEGNQRFKIKIIDYNLTTENEIICYTEKIINDTEFLINAESINNEYNSETIKKYNFKEKEYFLYGQEVDDFHILTYDFVWTVFASSVKEIDRQQQADKARIAELEQEVATQKSTIATILERLEKIETKSQ